MKDFFLVFLQYYVRHFPIDKGKNRLIQAFSKGFSPHLRQRITSLKHVPVRMTCDLSKHIQRDIFFWGTYHHEEQLLNFWMKFAQKSQIVFDIGANVGIYSLVAASTNLQAFVYAFEPTSEMSSKLSEHIKLNNLTNITLNEIAIGKVDEAGYVHVCKGDDGSNEGMNFVTSDNVAGCQETSIRSLDSYCKEHEIYYIDLMKMDIEGGEYDALLGMQYLLHKKAIGCIFLELAEWAANRYGHSTSDIKKLLSSNGYQLYEISSGMLQPINPHGVHNGESNILAFAQIPQVTSSSR